MSVRTEEDAVLTDLELDEPVRGVQEQLPNAGYRRIHSTSIKVTQARVRDSMYRPDPKV